MMLSVLVYFCIVGFAFTHLFSLYHCTKLDADSDKEALLSLKNHITQDPFEALSGWNDSLGFCQWNGVLCSKRHGRVIAIDLKAQNLIGTISPHIGNLSFIRSINLRRNFFHGEIPKEIGRLFRLRALVLTLNQLQGEIPISFGNCSDLRFLDLVVNRLEGKIPDEIGRFSKLSGLGLAVNNLTGPIPKSISNLTSLNQLSLSENSLSGDIPNELGNLRNLNMFQISANEFLAGQVPPQLFNISTMDYFAVAQNQLIGEIPPDIGFSIPNVRILLLGANKFKGPIPSSIANATKLENLTLAGNGFIGPVPTNLGNLKHLLRLNLGMNSLGTGRGNDLDFLHSLVNCSNLAVLAFNNNGLSGVLPNAIVNLSVNLNFLLMGANHEISGHIPHDINKLENLWSLAMEKNFFAGNIPSSIGYMKNLRELSIFGNAFSGEIPQSIGNLTSLVELSLEDNALQGSIPSTLGNCLALQKLRLSANNLSGPIPKEVIGLSSLSDFLDLSGNHLTGLIPEEIGRLRNLRLLDLSNNNLSGDIPSSIDGCNSLEFLNLGVNFLQGPIPSALKYIKGIRVLDLSCNNFTGSIPDFLSSLVFLTFLNLSFNSLEGRVPDQGIFRNVSRFSVTGNDNLCGGIKELQLKDCPPSQRHSKKLWENLYFRALIIVVCVLACLISISLFIVLAKKRSSRAKTSVGFNELLKVTYAELSRATDGFCSANLIGTGSYGSVYKGCLVREGESSVAVKVLDLQRKGAIKSFIRECEALRSLRHRNLVKMITSCSSIDFARNEFKALVFEYMPNGSLEEWLHKGAVDDDREQGIRNLNFMQRLSIALDVAHALDYLHHHAHSPIVHCDLKPSNVLLDEEMVARVGDFGLAKLMYDKNSQIHSSFSTNAVKGTIGYVAPEYGLGREVSIMGDVYSYGILVMELFTGKRPTDEMFKEDVSLHSFVEKAIPHDVTRIMDPKLLDVFIEDRSKMEDNLIQIFKIGVMCSKESPGERMDMDEVVVKLQIIKDMILA